LISQTSDAEKERGIFMSQQVMTNVFKVSRPRDVGTCIMADRMLALALIVALFAAEIAIVRFAGPDSPLAVDGQTYIVPIT
jgi:hypothetical protein